MAGPLVEEEEENNVVPDEDISIPVPSVPSSYEAPPGGSGGFQAPSGEKKFCVLIG